MSGLPLDRITAQPGSVLRQMEDGRPVWYLKGPDRNRRIKSVLFIRNDDDLYLVETPEGAELLPRDRLPSETVQQVRIIGPYTLRFECEDGLNVTMDSYENARLVLDLLMDFGGGFNPSDLRAFLAHMNAWVARRKEDER